MRIMFDSTNPDILPTNVDMVGGYINGKFAWSKEQWSLFGDAAKVRINVTGEVGRGNCLDVENGDATPDHVPAWFDSITWMHPSSRLVYCNRSNVDAVITALGNRQAALWVATLDGTILHTAGGRQVTACQYLGASQLGFNADLSVILTNWRPQTTE